MQISEFLEIKYGKGLKAESRDEGPYPVYGSNGIVGYHNSAITSGATIIIGRKGSVGKVHISDDRCWPIDTTYYIDSFTFPKSAKYWFYLLSSKNLSTINNATAIPGINRSQIYKLDVYPYSFEMQQRIADTLDKASELISLRKKQLEELDNLIKSIFYSMFGSPVTNERNWSIKNISDITNVETGSTPSRIIENYYLDGTIPWVKTGEIKEKYIYNTDEHITTIALEETNCKVLPVGTILVAMYGQGITRGKVGLLKIEAATNQACATVLPSNIFNSEYLFRLLLLQYKKLRQLGRGGNQPNLNLSMIKNFKIVLPPLPLQNQFAKIAEKIEEQKTLVQKALDQSQYLFDGLMARFFGE